MMGLLLQKGFAFTKLSTTDMWQVCTYNWGEREQVPHKRVVHELCLSVCIRLTVKTLSCKLKICVLGCYFKLEPCVAIKVSQH